MLVLSLFPGIGLLDRAFEAEGFCVVRGPDLLWGGDIHSFHPPPGKFDGIIGGPPCQLWSKAGRIANSTALDLVPEFVRCIEEAKPRWLVMENVTQAVKHPAIPRMWFQTKVRDYDCGGETSRTRAFWTWPFMLLVPQRAAGQPRHSVMATTHKRGSSSKRYVHDKHFLPGDLPLEEYARLQGVPELAHHLKQANTSRIMAIQLLGNGVPLAMGKVVARAVHHAVQPALSTAGDA